MEHSYSASIGSKYPSQLLPSVSTSSALDLNRVNSEVSPGIRVHVDAFVSGVKL